MKVGISLITLIILVVAIGILADWWLGPVKEYAGLKAMPFRELLVMLKLSWPLARY